MANKSFSYCICFGDLMPLSISSYQEPPIKPLIVSVACLFLYLVNFKPKAQLSGPFMVATRILPYNVLIKFFYSLANCINPSHGLVKYCLDRRLIFLVY